MLTAAAVLGCALDLLGRSASSLPPVEFVTAPPPGVSRQADAFLRREGGPVVVLVTSAEAFHQAQQGPHESGHREACRKVASVLVHEEWHLRHGSDEQGAYLAQLTALAAMGAHPSTISSVRKSMQVVVARQKDAERRLREVRKGRPDATVARR